jgi:succinyl-CoA synthetase beta subunit
MIAESLTFEKEFYFAILMDRASQGPVMVASPKGGMDIEAVAEETPDLIFKVLVFVHDVEYISCAALGKSVYK